MRRSIKWTGALATIAILGVSPLVFTGCDDDSSAERSFEKAGDKLEKAGDKMKDAAEDVGDGIKEGAEKVGDKIEDAVD